jgi:hypothetical protein
MNLIQILLPVAGNDEKAFPQEMFFDLRDELTDRFGGRTVFAQGAAESFWKGKDGTDRDRIVIFEVMADDIDEPWWRFPRERLQRKFRQEELVVRTQKLRRL